jgi:alcohol dehydrogenase class IV
VKSAKYQFHTPGRLLFGDGCSDDVGKWMKELGATRVLLVTDPGVVKVGFADRVRKALEAERLQVRIYDNVSENPTIADVDRGRDVILEQRIDGFVALGGGSPMDAAKAMAILAVHGGSIVEHELGLKPFSRPGAPLIAIPTTAGTGSESTKGAVISDPVTHRKFDVWDPLMAPRLALVDPLLTRSLPPSLTGSTGMDALTHAIEGYTATLASPLTDALHLKAILLLGANLLRAYRDGSDLEARRNLMMASMIAGVGFPNSGLGSVHGLSLPLGGRFGIPHGVANAIMLPHVMTFNLEACPQKFGEIAAALGAPGRGPAAAVEAVLALRRDLGIPRLSSFRVQEEDLPAMARDALGRNSNCVTNPRPTSEKDAVRIYQRALEEAL